LNVISISIPALRDRLVDIPRIAVKQLRFFAARSGKPSLSFAPEALAAMQTYPWPGNLRELRNVIERAAILAEGNQIEATDLGDVAHRRAELRLGDRVSLEEIENEHIRRVLENSRTVDEAAQILEIDPATLYRRKKRLGQG